MQNGVRGELRRDEEGNPIFVIVNQIKIYAHKEVYVQTEDAEMELTKMRPSKKFIDALNKMVHELIDTAFETALEDDRTDVKPEDLPSFE